MATPRLSPLTFDNLARRLVRDLSKLVHSGAVTERRLALMVGLSQSHLHNVVNGFRTLTPKVADQIMERLDWSLLDLVESSEAQALLKQRQADLAHGREIQLRHSAIGVGFRFPGAAFSEVSVPNSWLVRADNPIAVSAGIDETMEITLVEHDILLVDRGHAAVSEVHDDALYVVRWGDESRARWLRHSSRGLYLLSSSHWSEPLEWTLLEQPAGRRLEDVEGRIIGIARPPDGTFRRPVPPSVSS